MILEKKIKVKITKKNYEYYKKFFDVLNLRDIVEVDAIYLQKNSNIKVNVKCDICDTKRFIKFQAYSKNINSCAKYPIYTCDRCSHIKLKEYNLNNYGVEYYSQHPDRNNKVKATSIEKYGAEHFSQSEFFKPKVSKTNLEKFGFENPFMDSERIKTIFKEKYGAEHPSQVEEFKNKIKNTNLKKFGFESPLQSPEIREKIRITNLEKYDGHPMSNNDIRYLNTIIGRDKDCLSYEGDNNSLFKCDSGHNFLISSVLYHNRLRSNVPLCTICYPLSENRSIKEVELLNLIRENYKGEIITSYRDLLEIDIYLPDLKLGFEFNGLYWHSNQQKENDYHMKKTNYFRERGIRIIHIWEDDWDYKRDIISSQIKNWLGVSGSRIFARNCEAVEIFDSRLVGDFLDKNHIQGRVNSIKKYGLMYNNEIISIMTFDKFEGRKKMEEDGWNLNRFCNKLDLNIVGGASKLFKCFIKNNNPKRVVSYADRDWSIGDLYPRLGFKNIGETKCDYKYLVGDKRVHKSRYKKSKLKTNLSESKFMEESGISKVYDCGKIKFEFT